MPEQPFERESKAPDATLPSVVAGLKRGMRIRYSAHHSTLGRRDALARDVAAGYLSCARKRSQRTGNKASPFRDRNS